MIVNKKSLEAVTKTIKAVYLATLLAKAQEQMLYKKLAMIINSNSPEEVLSWIGDLPEVKEWLSERAKETLKYFDYTIKKKDWEATIKIMRDDILFDRLGVVKPRIMQLVEVGFAFYTKIIIDLLKAGETTKCYDGKYLFAANHDGVYNQANIFNYKLTPKAYGLARANMRKLKTYSGQTININPTHLIVPPALETTGLEIIKSTTVSGSTNIYQGTSELIVIPELTSDVEWYLADLSKGELKPFIMQMVKPFENSFAALDDQTSEAAFMRKEYYYGIDSIMNAAPGFWQLIYKGKGTTDLS